MRFVDTNVLLYSISTAPAERRKRAIAIALLDADDLALSVQVLHEFYSQATRATRTDSLSHDHAVDLIDSWLRYAAQDMTTGLLQAALVTTKRYRISCWDAAIVEAARALGCRTILSEDLNNGQNFDGVRVENPFAKP